MKYIVDNDLHIHSQLSSCSQDAEQNNERILRYAEENGLHTVCLTDHFWDTAVKPAFACYVGQDYEHICKAKPLPQSDKVRFLFGCETELDCELTVGVAKEKFELFDFIVIPTTHFAMPRYTITEEQSLTLENRVNAWVKRLEAVLSMPLPFEKVGLAHLVCPLLARLNFETPPFPRETYLEILEMLPEEEMKRLFTKAAKLGVGIELNSDDMKFADHEANTVLRPFHIAKACGCKFYCGSDAHHPAALDAAKPIFERAVELLGLQEEDKFILR